MEPSETVPPPAGGEPDAAPPRRPAKDFLLLWLAFAVVAGVVHAPLFGAEPVQDDVEQLYTSDPPRLAEPGRWLFEPYWLGRPPGAFNHYRPVQTAVVVTERFAFADSYAAMHAGAVAWSSLAALCVFLLVRRALCTSSELPPLLAALFFLVHPLHVEVMAQMVNRGEMIVAVIAIACCLLHTREGRSIKALVACAALTLVALLSKEHAVVIPALVAVFAVALAWKTGSLLPALRQTARRWTSFLVYPPAVIGAVALHVGALGGFLLVGGKALSGWPVGYRAHVATIVTGSYLQKMVVPAPLSLAYSGLLREQPSEQVGVLLLGASALVIAVLLALMPGRERPARACGVAWFGLAILPFSHVIPCTTVLADRNGYLASVGAALALGALFAELPAGRARLRRGVVVAVVVGLTVLAGVSFDRSRTWRTPMGVWADAVEKYPGSAGAQYNLGVAHWNLGRTEEAERAFAALVELKPAYVEAGVLHAKCLHRMGRRVEGRGELERLAERNPGDPLPQRELGRLLLIEGRAEDALRVLRAAIERFPGDPELLKLAERAKR